MFNLELLISERVVKISIGRVLGLTSANSDVSAFNTTNCLTSLVFWEI